MEGCCEERSGNTALKNVLRPMVRTSTTQVSGGERLDISVVFLFYFFIGISLFG